MEKGEGRGRGEEGEGIRKREEVERRSEKKGKGGISVERVNKGKDCGVKGKLIGEGEERRKIN